jgi:twitching motility protein PilT
MALVESLLTAIVRADGDALVMHVGEKPYVVASAGPIELSSQGLNLQAMAGMVAQLLPDDAQRSLAEFGAVEHELPSQPHIHDDRFSVVVARGGDDVWIEVRRHRDGSSTLAPVSTVATDEAPVAPTVDATADAIAYVAPELASTSVPEAADGASAVMIEPPVESTEFAPPMSDTTAEPQPASAADDEQPLPAADIESTVAAATDPPAELVSASWAEAPPATEDAVAADAHEPAPLLAPAFAQAEQVATAAETTSVFGRMDHAASYDGTYGSAGFGHSEPVASYGPKPDQPTSFASASSEHARDDHAEPVVAQATVIPMTRTLRIEVPSAPGSRATSRGSDVERLLGLASARGATALYLTTQAVPHVRVDADVRVLEGERALSATDIETAVLELMPDASGDAMRRGEPTEWAAEIAGIGPVRCSTFRDHRGPGAIFQLVSMRPMGAEQLGLSPEVQSLATEVEGLVVVASPAGSGKTAVVGALVDLINRQRRSYIITLEPQVRVVHESQHALISQRPVGTAPESAVLAARSALREAPDVLVIENLASADLLRVALEAAGAGILVIASVTAASTTAAVTSLIELVPADERRNVHTLMAERFRGAVAQVLLHNTAGGRVAAREVLLATAAVASLLASGQVQDLPRAIESGRKFGLVSQTDAFVQLLRQGAIDLREAYRKTDDRGALLAALKRENVDTAVIERLA